MIQRTYSYKYRSTCGTDVYEEDTIPNGKTREEAIRDEKEKQRLEKILTEFKQKSKKKL